MPLPELQKYYCQLRAERINSGLPIKGIRFRKRIHAILVSLVKLLRCLNRQKLTILKDCRKPTRRSVIYALTHVGRYDVEMSVEIIHAACSIDAQGSYKLRGIEKSSVCSFVRFGMSP